MNLRYRSNPYWHSGRGWATRCPLWVKSGHLRRTSPCLLCANSGHSRNRESKDRLAAVFAKQDQSFFIVALLLFLVAPGLFAPASRNGGGSTCTGSATCRARLFAASDRHWAILSALTKALRISAETLSSLVIASNVVGPDAAPRNFGSSIIMTPGGVAVTFEAICLTGLLQTMRGGGWRGHRRQRYQYGGRESRNSEFAHYNLPAG